MTKKLTQTELDEILRLHTIWLDSEGREGKYADLSYTDCSKLSFREANLAGANLPWTDLTGANLSGARLIVANLTEANLTGANLSVADLTGANLSGANLEEANLSGAESYPRFIQELINKKVE
jgi:uncharacterized protein YjbI with pentapeptide repeats